MSARGERRSMDALDWTLVAALCGAALLHTAWFDHVCDDAYISFRYAQNWAAGRGLVFNPGEYVMGFSNPSWVALLAALEAIGIPPPTSARGLGVLCNLATVALVYGLLRARTASRAAPLLGAALLAAAGPSALWAGAGLEGPLVGLLLTAALGVAASAAEQDRPRSGPALGLLLACLAVTRPDGALYAVPLCGTLWVWKRRRVAAWGALAAITGVVASALFAWSYYGDPLPNTSYAKFHPLSLALLTRGALFARAFAQVHWWAPLAIVVLWAAIAARERRATGWMAAAALAAFGLYYLRIGGDALVYYRMWAWVLPLFALLLGEALDALASRTARAPWIAGTVGLALVLAWLPNSLRGFDIEYLRMDDARIRDLSKVAATLRSMPEDLRIATNVIGVLAYESDRHVVDMLGLTDPVVARAPDKPLGIPAHESHDARRVLSLAPDIIFLGIPRAFAEPASLETALQPSFPSDRALFALPAFEADYRFGHLRLDDGRVVAVYARRTPR